MVLSMPAKARWGAGGCRRRLRLNGAVLTGFALALAAVPGGAEEADYVITFDKVAVRGFVGLFDTPEIAHLEPPGQERSAPPKEAGPPAPTPPEGIRRPAVFPLAFAPGQGTANPSFVQHGFLVEAFWAVKTGTVAGHFKHAHFHPPDLSSGFEAQHLGNPDELHGIYIRSLNGRPFGVKGLRYRVTRNRELARKPFSIQGFSNFSVNVLLARSFDPRWSIPGQFVTFPVGLAVGNDPTLPWWTLRIAGFELTEEVYIASSASVDLDDIALTRDEAMPSPSPSARPAAGDGGPDR